MTASREPQHIDHRNWYYEYPSHLLLVHEVVGDDGFFRRADFIKLPWWKIQISIKRAYRKRAKKPKKKVLRK